MRCFDLVRGLLMVTALLAAWPATPAAHGDDADPLYQAMEWRNIGPFRGGRSTAVAGVADQPLTYYFGSVGGGLWRTEDAGLSWRNLSDGHFRTGSVGAIAVAPSDSNVIWVGMGESPVRGVMTTHGDGVYRSTDRGQSWEHLGLRDSHHISRVQVHPRNPDIAWVAVQGKLWTDSEVRGIYKTDDGGQNWRRVLYVDEGTGASDLALDASNPRILYAAMWQHRRYPWRIESGGAGSGIWKSTDGGENWRPLSDGLPELMGKIGVAVSAANPSRVWAIVEAQDGGLFRSDDGGVKWSNINDKRVLRARSWYYMHIFADTQDENTLYVLNSPMLKSVDGGVTFKPVPTPHVDNHDLWINPDNSDYMINANDGGANVSLNGGTSWSTQSNQPTGQFYRVIADNRFPYWIYGGQQDNSAIAIASRSMGDSIGWKDWHSISGCESAFAAFDPDDPRYVYATCIAGIIGEYDMRTGTDRDVMAYSQLMLGVTPRDMKYRWNWNAPVVVSPHMPGTIYHAGNQVLRSMDRGVTWTEISPDLTRNEEDKLGPGGGPITNEAAGGETYHTIMSLVESPHRAGEIWAGTDDGRLHVTRNAGDDWEEVTPSRLGEHIINAIEISPHDPDTVWITVMGYKSGDLSPMIYRSRNSGRSWDQRVRGIPDNLIVRVVREDPERPGLLYAGTEAGVWVSFDNGEDWQPLALNLPAVPVTDLTIKGLDLVASTQGRAFWILDDLSPLRQYDDDLADLGLHLYEPAGAYLTGGSQAADPGAAGTNAPEGVAIDYYIAESLLVADSGDGGEIADNGSEAGDESTKPILRLEILDTAGNSVFSASAKRPDDQSGAFLEPKAGHNRFIWNLRHNRVRYLPETHEFPSWDGHRVAPGNYRVRLSLAERQMEGDLEVWPDPRKTFPAESIEERQAFLTDVRGRVNDIHDAVLKLRGVRRQVRDLQDRVEGLAGGEVIDQAGDELLDAIDTLEGELVNPKQETQQDIVNFTGQLNAEYLWLMSQVDITDPPINQGHRDYFRDLERKWAARRAELDALLGDLLDGFNALVDEHAIPAVILPEPE